MFYGSFFYDSSMLYLHSYYLYLYCRKPFTPDQLDVYWENLVLSLLGETIDDGDEVCGCRVVDKSPKKGDHRKIVLCYSHISPRNYSVIALVSWF
jgi:hypothetical protein